MTVQIIPFPCAFKSLSQRRIDWMVQRIEAMLDDPSKIADALPCEHKLAQLLNDQIAQSRLKP